MKHVAVNPTSEIYSQIQSASEVFNGRLFGGCLPPVVFTLQRGKQTMGYFSPARWRHVGGEQVGEIALNPAYFASRPLVQLFQTIVHEQCHVWQHSFGEPSRMGYHNNEWAEKMMEIGLMPSSTGEPGGLRTGQKMADYPIEYGPFLSACMDLVEQNVLLSWIDQEIDPFSIHERAAISKPSHQSAQSKLYTKLGAFFPDLNVRRDAARIALKRKAKYHCPVCRVNAWGKGGMSLICGVCGIDFEEQED
jgi:predicted SprT family Zn-dependent metalloprotease